MTKEKDDTTERFLRPSDGKLVELKVQTSSWLTSDTPIVIRIIDWLYRHEEAAIFMWLPGSLWILVLLLWPFTRLAGETRNGEKYDPILYRDWCYAKTARNPLENRAGAPRHVPELDEDIKEDTSLLRPRTDAEDEVEMQSLSSSTQPSLCRTPSAQAFEPDDDTVSKRELGPRYLCFLSDRHSAGYETVKVSDWLRRPTTMIEAEFVFVSYTRAQFCVSSADKINTWELSEDEKRALIAAVPGNKDQLARFGVEAAIAAGKPAFWLDFECVRNEHGMQEEEGQSGGCLTYLRSGSTSNA